jgi:AcrR family transcriptional regulator
VASLGKPFGFVDRRFWARDRSAGTVPQNRLRHMPRKKIVEATIDSHSEKRVSKVKRYLAPTLDAPVRSRLPRGSSSLPRDVVELEQRKRIVLGTAKVVAEHGYAEASVAQIIAQAGVSRATFYELFRDKEECFLFGFKKLSGAHIDEVEREITSAGSLPERLLTAMTSYLRRINVDQQLARAFIAEAQGATPKIREAFDEVQCRLQRGLQAWLDEVRRENPEISYSSSTDMSLLMNGLNGHVLSQVRAGIIFSDEHTVVICRFIFAALGLYEWAKHTQNRS